MHESIVKLWTPIIFMHFLSSSLVICLVSINLIMATGADTVVYSNYILALLMQLFVYAIASNRMATSVSINLRELPQFLELVESFVLISRAVVLLEPFTPLGGHLATEMFKE